MSKDLIMPASGLEDIRLRLTCFNSLLNTILKSMDDSDKMVDSMYSACDLLSCICRDFQADIECAALRMEKEEAAT